MIAKNKFREGWILLLQPFQFVEMAFPIQKHTMVYAYAEKPTFRRKLKKEAKEKIDDINNSPAFAFMSTNKAVSEVKEEKIIEIMDDPKSYDQIYTGEIVQTEMDNALLRFMPDEYKIISEDFLSDILSGEGYHTLISKKLETVKEYRDRFHYLQSRGINAVTARKWASIGYKDLVYYKPYGTLVEMYCREHEIYLPDVEYTILGDHYLQNIYGRPTISREIFSRQLKKILNFKKRWRFQ
jgi:hypothetical protein